MFSFSLTLYRWYGPPGTKTKFKESEGLLLERHLNGALTVTENAGQWIGVRESGIRAP